MSGMPQNPSMETPTNAVNQEVENEIDLMELLFRLLEKWKIIMLCAILGAAAFGAYTIYMIKPTYQATAKMYIVNPGDSMINLSDLQMGTSLANDYLEVFKTWELHETVIKELNLNYSYSKMQSMLNVTNPTNTRVLYITITSTNPKEAASLANGYARAAKDYIAETMSTKQPNILSVALEPANPSSPSKTRNIMLGFLLGALLAAGIVTIKFILDDKIKTADDIRRFAGMATLAVVPLSSPEAAKNAASAKKQKQRRAEK